MFMLMLDPLLFGVGGRDGEVFRMGVIARMLDGFGQFAGIGFGGVETDASAAAGEVDLSILGARNRFQSFFDVGDATGAGHAFDVEGDVSSVGCGGVVVMIVQHIHYPYSSAPRSEIVSGSVRHLLDPYTPIGYTESGIKSTLTFFIEDLNKNLSDRLKRVEGQVRGVERMLQEDQPCAQLLHQIPATQAALHGVSVVVLRNYLEPWFT